MRSPWKGLTAARRLAAARSFWADPDMAEPHAQAVGAIARSMNFRLRTAAALDAEKKARYLANMPNLPDALASRALVAYHLSAHRPMLAAFLDALGIEHRDGVITAESVAAPDPVRLSSAERTLAEQFPREDVTLYLSTLAWHDPDVWGGLADVVADLEPA
jgi:hypothetical protein